MQRPRGKGQRGHTRAHTSCCRRLHRFSARPRRDLRRSLWKNRGRGGEDGLAKGTRRAEFGARRDMRRMDTLAARRPGMEEAARGGGRGWGREYQERRFPKEKFLMWFHHLNPDVGAETTKTRLARFRAERAARQARERAGKRPPFRVGVYKLDGIGADVTVAGFSSSSSSSTDVAQTLQESFLPRQRTRRRPARFPSRSGRRHPEERSWSTSPRETGLLHGKVGWLVGQPLCILEC